MNGKRVLTGRYFMMGNVACAEGAIAAGCEFTAGYPITPATEVANRLAERLPQVGGAFFQMEDEISAIAAVVGASWAGRKAMTVTYVVQGWRQSNGQLWRHNMITRVIDPIIGLDRDMLISRITYTLSEQGTITKLELGPPESFEPEPKDPHSKRKVKKGGKGDNFEYLIPADYEPKK